MIKLSLLIFFISSSVFANLHLSPSNFNSQDGSHSIFVDFKLAEYDLIYDLKKRETIVKSKITFIASKMGNPLFDLVPRPREVLLNGKSVEVVEISAPNGQKLRQIQSLISPGEHVLELVNTFSENVRYNPILKRVSSAFWIRDLKTRMFLEQYIPSNFEYDQYQMIFNVVFEGVEEAKQDIYTNGKVTKLSSNSYRVVFPEYYTVSCPYFHVTPKGQKKRIDFNYQSIDGRMIPMTVYTSWWSRPIKFKDETLRVLKELEKDYGPWGHDTFVAYETFPGTGGMEHAGATQTSFAALDHEMLHSYFAKGIMPANGNSGWIDEAIASWRDNGYQRKPLPAMSGSDLGKGSEYQRNTDDRAYGIGREFMAYLDYRLQDVGGLKVFLKGYFAAYKHTVITQEHFKNNLEFFSGLDLTEAFDTYIWGVNSLTDESMMSQKNSAHKALTRLELLSIL